MADLNVQKASINGLDIAFASASAGGDKFLNLDEKTSIIVKNDGAAEITVTIDSIEKCNQGFDHDVSVDVAAGEQAIVGPFKQSRFNDETQKVSISYSDSTSVEVAVISAA